MSQFLEQHPMLTRSRLLVLLNNHDGTVVISVVRPLEHAGGVIKNPILGIECLTLRLAIHNHIG